MKNVKNILSVALVVLFAVAVLTSCGNNPPADYEGEGQSIGEGSVTFRFEVTNADGETSAWNVSTDEETVGAALLEVGLIAGTVYDWGLMVTCINGVCAGDEAFWAFWVDGAMSNYGVDSTNIEPGIVYAFVYTPF